MKKKTLLTSLAAIMACCTLASCGGTSEQSSSVASSEPSVASSSEDSKVVSSSIYENPMSYAPVNWDYDTAWGKHTVGGTMKAEEYYDNFPEMTNKIATFNYLVVNQPVDPSKCLRSSLFDDNLEKEGAEYFAEIARKIVPDWNSEESRTSAEKQEKNVLAIYDWVVSHTYYDNLIVDRDGVTQGYYLTGIMNNSVLDDNPYKIKVFTVCRGYCNLILVMMNGIGIPCIEDKGREYYTTTGKISDTSNHVWNEVYYGGRWHVLDATWESNVAGGGYWYNCDTHAYTDGSYDNTNRLYFDTIPSYSSWEDCRNYTNYYRQTHIIEQRGEGEAFIDNAIMTLGNGFSTYFTIDDIFSGKVLLKGYSGTGTEISTPEEVDFSYNYTNSSEQAVDVNFSIPVGGLAPEAYDGMTGVKKVTVNVKDGVEGFKVFKQAFRNNTDLEEVVFDEGVTYVQGTSFKGDSKLTKITFMGDPVDSNGNFLQCANAVVYYPAANSNWAAEGVIVDGQYRGHTAVAY